MKTFAVALADPNPIHLDPEAVKAAGLGDRVINQGPAGLGYLLNMLHEAVPRGERREPQGPLHPPTSTAAIASRAAGVVDSVADGRADAASGSTSTGSKRALSTAGHARPAP